MMATTEFTAILTTPSGEASEYRVSAANKTEARKKIGALYRRDTPPPSAGFYSFNQTRLRWIEAAQ